jgi:hypothetical protein
MLVDPYTSVSTKFVRFDYLSKHRDDPLVYELHWLDKTMIEASKEYSEAVKEAFDLMPRFFGKSSP